MSAVLRVKRRLNEDPLEAVLLNCKRQKTERDGASNTNDLTTILKFAGTIESADNDVFLHIKRTTVTEEEEYRRHTTKIIEKLRQQNRLASKSNRFKVVNAFRSSASTSRQNVQAPRKCTVVDIQTYSPREADGTRASSSDSRYVYDLYYTNSNDLSDADLNEFVSVYPLSDGVIYGTHDDDDTESESEDSDDSNAENNWRNDYPDESDVESTKGDDDDNSSIDEEDMLKAMKRVNLDDDDSSSDEYDITNGYNEDYEYIDGYIYHRPKPETEQSCYYSQYDECCTP